jgi:hypothetical protein
MSWNNYNIGIPNKLIPLGELVVLTTGTTLNGHITTPGHIYASYRCTRLIAQIDYAEVVLAQTDGAGVNIKIIGPRRGETLAWNFTGEDVIGWNSVGGIGAAQDWIAMCYCQDPCTFPSGNPMSGQTLNYGEGYHYNLTNIGGTAFNNVNLQG